MNDKDIRRILIAYLQVSGKKMRIYQEKSIGASVCDVMVVTDRLMGYEIKSDLDNYQRMSAQISAYSQFFDENYLVVSRRHLRSALDKIPAEWGIICICDRSVTVEQAVSRSRKVDRRQLSILWKLELKNLLIKNNMPLYAQKEKGYIADRITEYIPPLKFGSQIAQELISLLDRVETPSKEITFEQLEVNSLFLDEAHDYKNIPIRTKLRDLRGISTNSSTKCLDMLQKVRCVQEQNGGRGVIFATGTPLCNSISDVVHHAAVPSEQRAREAGAASV